HLKMLELTQIQVTDAGLEAVKDLPNLERLYVYEAPITGPGLKHLRGLTKLETLLLRGTKLNDDGLRNLEGLSGLRLLDLSDSTSTSYLAEYTEVGIARLKQALPGCQVQAVKISDLQR